ncbi:outer membrane autotransporter protein [Ereboglobus sp. PH5-10]|uniref:autotransporter outer membrane beta-barrel domain-containing protein n=1 Tax=Ereboglobus sp. PH5-10 TaxID=2940629 RepID=UPI0024053ACB|nr:autotransporter outer membrane beta-barrel domain-containing protein [Ereboglobus sp. PH5-10]MDF9827980.1 outer membrane autotransporter protein [Ereboglobus sp. PH5-10]
MKNQMNYHDRFNTTGLLRALLFLACAAFTLQAQLRADELVWNNTDNSNTWLGSGVNANWWHAGNAATAAFADGDAAVFGRAGSGAAITTGTIAIANAVTLGASGTNAGVIFNGGTWAFTGAGIIGGSIRFAGDTDLAFDTRTVTQRMSIDAGRAVTLRALAGSTVTVTTGSFTGNGGAVLVNMGATLTVNSTDSARLVFADNKASLGGAAIASTGGTVSVNGGLFANNTAGATSRYQGGGAIFARSEGRLDVTGAVFTNNNTSGSVDGTGGGAIYALGTPLTIVSSTFLQNTTSSNGGAIFTENTTVSIRDTLFESNRATGRNGGALTVWNSSTTILVDVDFTNNKASGLGVTAGAVYINAANRSNHVSNVTVGVSPGRTSTYFGNAFGSTANSIAFGGWGNHKVYLTATVGAGGMLDMQDPMRIRPNLFNKYDSIYMGVTKTGSGVWRLGGATILTGTVGNDFAVDEGGLALYAGASITLNNQGSTSDSAAVEDTFTLAANTTLSTLGVTTTGAAAPVTATGTIRADTITLADNSAINIGSSLVLTATTLNYGNARVTADATARLVLDQKSGPLELTGSRTFEVADRKNLTVSARFAAPADGEFSLVALNTTGTHSGSTTFTAPALATGNGGVMQAGSGATFTATTTGGAVIAFSENSAQQGGAIAATNDNIINITNALFTSNTATSAGTGAGGGAIFAADRTILNITSGTFSGNTSAYHGGAVYVYNSGISGSSVTIADTLFTGNTAARNGGALTIWNSPNITLTDVSFIDNTAGGYGGAAHINAANITGHTTNLYINVSAGNTSTYAGNTAAGAASGLSFAAIDACAVNIDFNIAADGLLDMRDPMAVSDLYNALQISATKTGAGEMRLGGVSTLTGTTGNIFRVDEGALALYAGASLTLDNQGTPPAAADAVDAFALATGATLAVLTGTSPDDTGVSYAGATIRADDITLAAGCTLKLFSGADAASITGTGAHPIDGTPVTADDTASASTLTLAGSTLAIGDRVNIDLTVTSFAAGNQTVTLLDAAGVTGVTGTFDPKTFSLHINGIDTETLDNNRLDVHQLQSTDTGKLDFHYHSTGNHLVTWTGSSGSGWNNADRNWHLNYNGTDYDQFLNGDAVLFDDTAAANANNITLADTIYIAPVGANPAMRVTGTGSWSFAGAGIADANPDAPASLLMESTGTLALSNTNTYSGGTRITAGTLVAKNARALGTGDIDNTAFLILDIATDAEGGRLAQVIAGTGTTIKTGEGTITTSGDIANDIIAAAGILANTGAITGATTIDSGTLLNTGTLAALTLNAGLGANAGLVTGAVTQSAGLLINETDGTLATTLVVNGGTFANNGGAVIGAATIAPAGTLVFHGGTLAAITADGALNFENAGDYTHAAVISGSTGAITKTGTGDLVLAAANTFSGATDIQAGTLRLAVANALAQSATISLASETRLDLAGLDQTLKTLAAAPDARIAFNTTGANHRVLALDSLAGDGAVFEMRTDLAAAAGDKITIVGASAGAHRIEIDNANGSEIQPDTAIPLVIMNQAGATFSGTTESGIYTLTVQQGDGGAIMPSTNTWYLGSGNRPSRAVDGILATAAAAGQDWHYELDSLHKRMGDLRAAPDAAGSGNIWLRASSHRLNGALELTGRSFHQYAHGLAFGADKALAANTGASAWYLGGFASINYIDRSFDSSGGDGDTNAIGGGAYATWLHKDGWFADIIARFDRRQNEFNARSIDNHITRGKYTTISEGASVEFGRRLTRATNGWWVEPSAQFAIVHIGDADYDATSPGAEPIRVAVDSLTSSQSRAQVRFGGDIARAPGLHPYAKAGAVYTASGGGEITAGGRRMKVDYDGWRVEFGIGAAYEIDAKSQVYLDYEYAKAALYERPWSIHLGYRRAW